MHTPLYWAEKKFSWMKPSDIVPTIKAIQEDARKGTILVGIDLANGKDITINREIKNETDITE